MPVSQKTNNLEGKKEKKEKTNDNTVQDKGYIRSSIQKIKKRMNI